MVSQTEDGQALLDSVPDILYLLSGALDAISLDEELVAIMSILLQRLLRGDVRALVRDIGRASNGSERGIEYCVSSARLLAFLCKDPDVADCVMRAGPVDLSDGTEASATAEGQSTLLEGTSSMLAQVIRLASTCIEPRAQLALLESIREIANSSPLGQKRCIEVGAMANLVALLSANFESAELVEAAALALQALVSDEAGAVGLLALDPPVETTEGHPGTDDQSVVEALVLTLLKLHAPSASVAANAILSLVEHLLVHGGTLTDEGLQHAIAAAVEAMIANPSNPALHRSALTLLNAGVGSTTALDAALGAGVLPVLIDDLSSSCGLFPEDSHGGSTDPGTVELANDSEY